jgi:NADH-quinone oxidoreductase subunit F
MFGMLMAGYLVGAKVGVLYIRDEYPAAITQTEQAISEFEALSLNYTDGFDFRFKIVRGAGAYICGEETALLRSIEGQRPIVSGRPPFPAHCGLLGCPTVLYNVETFASIHFILNGNVENYHAIGNGKSTGSKLVSLDSSFTIPGIYEVAMGSSLQAVFDLAGGYAKPLKALHIGGPLGGVVPIEKVKNLSVDFESFANEGFLLGHASVIGLPEQTKMIEYIEHLFDFTAMESCGKCYPCKLGAVRGQEMVQSAISGEQAIDAELLNDLLETMQLGSLCALGGGVPLPIQNILQYFADEISPFLAKETDYKELAHE